MRRLLMLACAFALTVPALGTTPASAAISCSVQANHGDPPYSITAAVNCPTGTELFLCSAVVTVVAEPVPVPAVPVIPNNLTVQPTCGNSYSTIATSDNNLLLGSRRVVAAFTFATLAEDVSLVIGGNTQTLVCVPDIVVPDLIVHACVAISDSYSIP